MEEKKKKEMSTTAKIICVVIIVICFVAGFFIGRNLFNTSDKKEDKKEEKKEVASKLYNMKDGDISLDDEELKEYISIFASSELRDEYYSIINGTSKENIETVHQAKISLALAMTPYDDKMMSCGDINVDAETIMKGYYCGSMTDEMAKYYADSKTNMFHEAERKNNTKIKYGDKVESNYKMLFGDDGDFYHESAYLSYSRLGYSPKNDVYAEYQCQCGGISASVEEKATKAYKENNIITIIYERTIGENFGDPLKGEAKVTLKWDEKVQRYVFESRAIVNN